MKVRARVTRGDFQTNKFEAEKFSASKLRVWRWVMGWEIHDAKPTRDKKMMRKVSFCLSLSLALSFARSLTRSLARLARGLLQRIRNAREPVFQADCRPQVTYIYPLVCCSRAENSRRRDARAVILMPLITVIHLRMGSWGQDIERERDKRNRFLKSHCCCCCRCRCCCCGTSYASVNLSICCCADAKLPLRSVIDLISERASGVARPSTHAAVLSQDPLFPTGLQTRSGTSHTGAASLTRVCQS